MLPILTLPNPKLRERSAEVLPEEITKPDFQAWIDELIRTMHQADGVGLAAPQVGRQIRVFIAMDVSTPHVIINPVVVRYSWGMADDEEGCLSVPGKYGMVRRYKVFHLTGLDRQGNKIKLAARGYFARVLQHELDHLDGILYVDRAKKVYSANI
jgi:peptide deformylase